jgi:peptide-methionine (S)-S-oxide reductase
VTSGYAGGSKATAEYEAVSSGSTGHAESIKIVYDPKIITYGRLLQIYFSVAHDPTQLNRQGPDRGTQYRSAIFPQTDEQAKLAKEYISQLNRAHVYDAAIVTKVERGKAFYPAEAYHQNFLANNPTSGYIIVNDLPKIDSLQRMFPDDFKKRPVLVTASGG